MRTEDRVLEELGRAVAEAAGDGPSDARRAAQKRAIVARASARTARRRSPLGRTLGWAAAAAAAAAALVAVGSWNTADSRTEPIRFFVGSSTIPARPGAGLAAGPDAPLPIRFEEGTVFGLDRGATARVERSDATEVRVTLEAGRLDADIRTHGRSRWVVAAGPYEVIAVGTRFTVAWRESERALAVAVAEGTVAVRGDEFGGAGVRVSAGRRIETSRRAEETPLQTAPPLPAPGPDPLDATGPVVRESPAGPTAGTADETAFDPPPPEAAAADDRVAAGGPETERPTRPTSPPSAPDWRSLAEQRRYAEAIAAAEAEGLARLAEEVGAEDLLRLADASRYARRPDVAGSLLTALRRRFGGSGAAATAAFQLGRLAADLRGAPVEAAAWFETYLGESPGGPLAEEALGRLVDLLHASGRRAAAVAAARTYLARYPTGPFRALAESVVLEEGPGEP
jgi:hypothetical protein